MLSNADGGGVSNFPENSVTKLTLLALRGGGWGSRREDCYGTCEES